jgi:hypothetical protein
MEFADKGYNLAAVRNSTEYLDAAEKTKQQVYVLSLFSSHSRSSSHDYHNDILG